jgi:hypothetical protein
METRRRERRQGALQQVREWQEILRSRRRLRKWRTGTAQYAIDSGTRQPELSGMCIG